MTYVKPFHGHWFIAWTRFYAPSIYYTALRTTTQDDETRFNIQGTNDWIISSIPPKYSETGELKNYYINRKKTNSMDRDLMLSFMYNGLCPLVMKEV